MRKRFFWCSAVAPLGCVIVSTLFVFVTRLDRKGIKVIGYIEKGVNPASFSDIYWTGPLVARGFKVGVVSGLVALTVSSHHKLQRLKIRFTNIEDSCRTLHPQSILCA